ncbi:CHAT domain-containing protein [Thiothrix subterranea]|uniref:CHAT domain-containing protein n=1 Tax=Thiothrix subterranea TaxID=2735563 RepID=UPI0035ABA35A
MVWRCLSAEPSDAALQLASKFWAALQDQTDNGIQHAQQIAYVFGADKHTPCGLTLHEAERWQMLGTQQGDGTVTWASGKLTGLANTWFMPVDHARLTCDKRYFNAITALLLTGKTDALTQQLPSTSRGMRSVYPYEPRPVLRPSNEELEMAFFRTTPQRELNQDLAQALQVSVYAMDLRFTQHPIICGHYLADGIAGTEAQIDQHLLDGALTQRSRLGIYAGDSGTNTIVLKARSPEDRKRGTRHGAIIVGLGEWNTITAQTIAETVRDGVLEYLLYSAEHDVALDSDSIIKPLILNSLLVGYNSTAHISIVSSIDAIVRGVCAANQQFRNTKLKPGLCVGELRFVEFFLDTAITAAHAVRELPLRVEKDLERLEARVIPASELKFYKEAPRQRLSERSAGGYWARLMITNDDDTAETNAIAKKLKYVFLSERARAEAIEHMRQPGLIEALIREQVTKPSYDADVCRTLFQLMIPLDFKTAARQTEQLLLVLDAYTANLPWEMLQADDEPLALKMAMVRQLVALRYRKTVRGSLKNTACVIGNPATTGFFRHYPVDNQPRSPTGDGSLASLRGATEEAHAVAQALRTANYAVETLYPASPNAAPEHTAIQVFNTLFKRPYRILMIAAHGVVGIVGKDGVERSGVVLSDGVMITAAEVGQMEAGAGFGVPQLLPFG